MSIRYLNYFILVIFLFFGSCSQKNDVDDIIKIFQKHSYYSLGPDKVKEIISNKGFDGFKEIDKNAGFIDKKFPKSNKFKESLAFPGFIVQNINAGLVVKKIFEASYASDIEGFDEGCIIKSLNNLPISDINFPLDNFFKKPGDSVKIGFEKDGILKEMPIKTSYPYFSVVWGFNIPEYNSIYLRVLALPSGISNIIENEYIKLSMKHKVETLIIDLRSTIYGQLNGLIETLSLFTNKGDLLFETESNREGYKSKFYSEKEGKLKNKKMILIVNSQTSGFSEILAEILKDLKNAYIIGEDTAGNLQITKTFKLRSGKYFSVTVALIKTAKNIVNKVNIDKQIKCDSDKKIDFSMIPFPLLDMDKCYMEAYSLLK